MNIIDTLLVYLSLLTATGLQAAPTPEVTPVPTPAPTAIVEQQATQAPEGGVQGTITLTAAPATQAPEPTLTPNASYGYLRQGNRGEEVRRLQTRLRELGYLNGNVDGAFGRQTYNAVIAFQHANGLTADGVAGQATLTQLYENPKVQPNLARVTVSPEPTATPDASGAIPLPENPSGIWVDQQCETVLVAGEAVSLPNGAAPHVYLRGREVLISLTELVEAVPSFSAVGGDSTRLVLTAAGHTVTIYLPSGVTRDARDTSYCDTYSADVDGQGLATRQGDVVYEDGRWTVTDTWLASAIHASVLWDVDEFTLIIQPRSGVD